MTVSDSDKRAAMALADSDLQLVPQEAGASLDTQYKVVQVHTTRRKFQAIADNRAGKAGGREGYRVGPVNR